MLKSGASLEEMLPRLEHAATAAQQEARFAILALSSASGSAPFDAGLARYIEFLVADGQLDVDLTSTRGTPCARRGDRGLPDRPGRARERPKTRRCPERGRLDPAEERTPRRHGLRRRLGNRRGRPRGGTGAEEHAAVRPRSRGRCRSLLAGRGNGDRGRRRARPSYASLRGGDAARAEIAGRPDRAPPPDGTGARAAERRRRAAAPAASSSCRRRPRLPGTGARARRRARRPASASKPHGADNDELRLEREHLVPRRRAGRLGRPGRGVVASGELDHLRQPVPGAERRLEPLGEEHPPARQAAHRAAAASIVSRICAAIRSPRSATPSRRCEGADRAPRRRASVRGSSESTSAPTGQADGELSARDGADGAEVLGHDQVGGERIDQVGVDRVQRVPVSAPTSRTASSISRLDSVAGSIRPLSRRASRSPREASGTPPRPRRASPPGRGPR